MAVVMVMVIITMAASGNGAKVVTVLAASLNIGGKMILTRPSAPVAAVAVKRRHPPPLPHGAVVTLTLTEKAETRLHYHPITKCAILENLPLHVFLKTETSDCLCSLDVVLCAQCVDGNGNS